MIAVFPKLKVWAAFYGISVSILDAAVLDAFQKALKQQAAKIQELFDCDVLHLKWNDLKVGSRPDAESVNESASKLKLGNPEMYTTLRNWYPEVVGQLPLHMARLVCQRSNCWWDSKLRRRFSAWMMAILVLVTILVFSIGLFGGMSLEKFVLAVFAPLSPAFLWGIREYKKQTEAAEALDRIKSYTESLWAEAMKNNLTPEQIERESRNLQYEIYERRRDNPLIFDWIYRRLRSMLEEQANRGAEELVEEALQALSQDAKQ